MHCSCVNVAAPTSTADVQPGKSPLLGLVFWALQAHPWSHLPPPPCEVCYHQQTLPDSCPQGRGLKGECRQGTADPFRSQHPPQPAIASSGCIDATELCTVSVRGACPSHIIDSLAFCLVSWWWGLGMVGARLGGQSRGKTSCLHLARRNQPTKQYHHWNLPSL